MIEFVINTAFDILDMEIKSYVLMNKYDEIPYSLPSDLDICVPQQDFLRLDEIMCKISKATGLVLTQKIRHNYRKCAYIFTPLHVMEKFRLQLDFFSDFSVAATPLLIPYQEIQRKTRKCGRYTIPDYDLEYTFLLMRRIYKNDFDAEHCAVLANVLKGREVKCIEYAANYFERSLMESVCDLILKNDFQTLAERHIELKKALKKCSRTHAKRLYFLKYWTDFVFRAFYRARYPVGMSVALLAPDGGGKTTVIDALKTTCWGSFHGIQVEYFRPNLLANAGHYKPINPTEPSKTNPNPHDVSTDGKIKSLARFFFYNLDFLFGGVKIQLLKIKKKLIVFDRYYYDYFVDLKRYKYSFSPLIPKIFRFMIPSPNVVFILIGTPSVLYQRKKELDIEELSRQIKAYKSLKKMYKKAVLVDVDLPLNDVVDEITKSIILYKAGRTAKAMKRKIDSKGIIIC